MAQGRVNRENGELISLTESKFHAHSLFFIISYHKNLRTS